MDNFMNVPEIIPITENNIIEEYRMNPDVKSVAKVYGISTKEVRDILKRAGIKTIMKKKTSPSALEDIGMTERDFYCDVRK